MKKKHSTKNLNYLSPEYMRAMNDVARLLKREAKSFEEKADREFEAYSLNGYVKLIAVAQSLSMFSHLLKTERYIRAEVMKK